jgi:23S rRNA (guanine2445-N2)-methyltransferase / 23S rRNA (guanine2069-N7)-methyltransferase
MDSSADKLSLYYARTLTGLEEGLARELVAVGAQNVQPEGRAVRFQADRRVLYAANLWCRTAIRILKPLGEFPAADEDQLYASVQKIAWAEWMPATGTLAVDAAVRSSFTTHSLYVSQLAKDAIVDQFRERTGKRPSVDLKDPGLRIAIALNENRLQVFTDSSGESLHRRGYRRATGEAPVNEVLAAGILMLAGWDGKTPLVDPMCGSGTFLIEAALMARRMAPGLQRRSFGFQRWPDYDRKIFDSLVEEACTAELDSVEVPLLGIEIDPQVAQIARDNARRAGVDADIRVEQGDFFQYDKLPGTAGTVVMNPPYDERLEVERIGEMYEEIGDRLKQRWAGWTAHVLTGNLEAAKRFGLRASRKIPLWNGPIECRLMKFEMTARAADTTAQGPAWRAPTKVTLTEESPPIENPKWKNQIESFANRFKKDAKHLGKWAKRQGITCYRIYDRDIPEVPLMIDLYGDRLHAAELERNHDRSPAEHAAWLKACLKAAAESIGIAPDKVYLKRRKQQKGSAQYTPQAETGETLEVEEGGHKFLVNLADYLDTGLFLDHRLSRARVEAEAAGKDFLNLFSYTGAFTVYAAAGGAKSTTTVDTSQTYLRWAEKNLALNGFSGPAHKFVREDVMEYLEGLSPKVAFDLAVVDPPTFSNSKTTGRVFDIQKDHGRLLSLVLAHIRPGGVVYFSTNFRKFKFEAELAGVQIEEITRQTVSLDFERHKSHRSWRLARPLL